MNPFVVALDDPKIVEARPRCEYQPGEHFLISANAGLHIRRLVEIDEDEALLPIPLVPYQWRTSMPAFSIVGRDRKSSAPTAAASSPTSGTLLAFPKLSFWKMPVAISMTVNAVKASPPCTALPASFTAAESVSSPKRMAVAISEL
ncbi:hypothetical protein [Mesorhizobium sp. M0870]|uniref:hypothetical protein n=1 Tax=Mesorhizobium sp. M0870 TaxID=2957016 RepID=UPI003335AE11